MANLQSESPSHGLRYYLTQYWPENGDPRTVGLPLIREGPWACYTVIAIYLLFVTRWGPSMMAKRQPYKMRAPMLVYNITMVVINFYFLLKSMKWLNYGQHLLNFRYPPVSDSVTFSSGSNEHIWEFYLYWLTKFVDLFDTVFFVLRKKYNQVSVLHLYHHSIVPILGWHYQWYTTHIPAVCLFAFLNSTVHVIMYSYYALAALGPKVQPYLWWKKYITQIQLVQFGILAFYAIVVYTNAVNYPSAAYWIATSQPPIFFTFFCNFYINSYRKTKKV